MNIMPIPISFIIERISLSWQDALWGYERQKIGWSDIVGLANKRLSLGSGDREIELSGIDKEETFRVGELLRELALTEAEQSEDTSVRKWLFLELAWLFEKREHIKDALVQVESIYADYDYPSEIESFVYYMPVDDDYDPSTHSREENEARLFGKWGIYLQKCQAEFR